VLAFEHDVAGLFVNRCMEIILFRLSVSTSIIHIYFYVGGVELPLNSLSSFTFLYNELTVFT